MVLGIPIQATKRSQAQIDQQLSAHQSYEPLLLNWPTAHHRRRQACSLNETLTYWTSLCTQLPRRKVCPIKICWLLRTPADTSAAVLASFKPSGHHSDKLKSFNSLWLFAIASKTFMFFGVLRSDAICVVRLNACGKVFSCEYLKIAWTNFGMFWWYCLPRRRPIH